MKTKQDNSNTMDLPKAISTLRAHQHWRMNSKNAIGMPESALVGQAIEVVLRHLDKDCKFTEVEE